MASTHTESAIALGDFVESLNGKSVQISQAISWRPGTGFEHHSTVHSRFIFQVELTLWSMSGGHYMLFGAHEISYGIGTNKLFSVQISPDEAIVIERYGDEAERRSSIKVVAAEKPNISSSSDAQSAPVNPSRLG
ncbi:hypothetical protein GM658_10815 [Pseudoduganella eburnea]|uniref:Uncharacterized protein n=1 Tax=Massilia eburnea TaxID=1776165 RepID=A0A6L6QG69_9BURK|nr:hypothetical protein [Massilia eburnea]MTW11094.1 hypothetical protein [Massilia eburnea]